MERWKEYREQLTPLGKKPVLFVMMNDTDEADDVGDWLQKKYPSEFGGEKLLIIHTDNRAKYRRRIWTRRARFRARSTTRRARSTASSAC